MTTMTPSRPLHTTGATAELFADSFDSWIEPAEALSHDISAPSATNAMKWTVWTENDAGSDWPAEAAEVFQPVETSRNAERALRGFALFIVGLTGLVLLASLFSFGVSRLRRPLPLSSALPKISTQQRARWQNAITQNAFEFARLQAKSQGHSLSANEKQSAAQKAILQTVNAGGPDYSNFAAAKTAGAVNNTLWNLASQGAARGGTLPIRAAHRVAARTYSAPVRHTRVAHTKRRPAPQRHAVILGRGPVREDTSSIIVIRD